MTTSTARPSSPQDAWLLGARGAPSAHNTQPWRFVPRPDGSVLVRWSPERTLPAADPANRDLYLGLGAAVESARLSAAAGGAALIFRPAADHEDRTVGCLRPSDDPVAAADLELARALDKRRTARAPHLRRPLPAGLLATLQAAAEPAGCRLHLVVRRPAIKQLARLAARATAAQFADPLIQAELWRWLRLDPRAREYQRDGLTADCLELRGAALTVARAVLPPARMRQLVRLGAHHLLALDTQRLVGQSTALCLFTAPSDRRADLVQSGRVLLRLWLIATAAGLSTHPVSALLDCAATAGPAVAVFGAEGETPAALFRLGAAPAVARAPRLPAEELVEAASPPRRPR